jgi:hypothetical protein
MAWTEDFRAGPSNDERLTHSAIEHLRPARRWSGMILAGAALLGLLSVAPGCIHAKRTVSGQYVPADLPPEARFEVRATGGRSCKVTLSWKPQTATVSGAELPCSEISFQIQSPDGRLDYDTFTTASGWVLKNVRLRSGSDRDHLVLTSQHYLTLQPRMTEYVLGSNDTGTMTFKQSSSILIDPEGHALGGTD